MLENKDYREEADEPAHTERPLTPFLRPPLPPPELRPTAPVVGPRLPPGRRPQPNRRSSGIGCLHQSGGQLPLLLDQSCSLGGALSYTRTRCASPASTTAVTPAVVVVVATPNIFADTPTVAVSTVAAVAA